MSGHGLSVAGITFVTRWDLLTTKTRTNRQGGRGRALSTARNGLTHGDAVVS